MQNEKRSLRPSLVSDVSSNNTRQIAASAIASEGVIWNWKRCSNYMQPTPLAKSRDNFLPFIILLSRDIMQLCVDFHSYPYSHYVCDRRASEFVFVHMHRWHLYLLMDFHCHSRWKSGFIAFRGRRECHIAPRQCHVGRCQRLSRGCYTLLLSLWIVSFVVVAVSLW